MLTPEADKIYKKVKVLLKEKDKTKSQIDKLAHDIKEELKTIRNVKLDILTENAAERTSNTPDYHLLDELRQLTKYNKMAHDKEAKLKDATTRYKELSKSIEYHEYWMVQANSDDPNKQKKAHKVIFG